jgi:hypothetical protein
MSFVSNLSASSHATFINTPHLINTVLNQGKSIQYLKKTPMTNLITRTFSTPCLQTSLNNLGNSRTKLVTASVSFERSTESTMNKAANKYIAIPFLLMLGMIVDLSLTNSKQSEELKETKKQLNELKNKKEVALEEMAIEATSW